MDVVVAVLAKLRDQDNPFICEEEIEDLYCSKIQALILIKRRYWARTIGEEIRRRRTRREAEKEQKNAEQDTTTTAAATNDHSCATMEDPVEDAKNTERFGITAAEEVEQRVAAEVQRARVIEGFESEPAQAAARNEECCRATARIEFL